MKVIMDSQVQIQSAVDSDALITRQQIQAALQAMQALTLLRGVVQDEISSQILILLRFLAAPKPDAEAIASSYSLSFQVLASRANEDMVVYLADAWQAHLLGSLIDNRNPWAEQVEQVGSERVSARLRTQARRDLAALQRLFQLTGSSLLSLVEQLVTPELPLLHDAWTSWLDLQPLPLEEPVHPRDLLASRIAACSDWSTLVEDLERYWARHGTGVLARFQVLRWQTAGKRLIGISHPDPIQFANLIGQERQQQRLSTNIERFLAGLPTQDMLLYGPPGTGKSSTVKALVNAYAAQGLCLVEVNKGEIDDLPLLLTELRGRAPRYLLFIDDLSFEEHETAYKALKVALEGTAAARPANVLICATSNRLNLIRESFAERGQPEMDINWRDTMDEKQSLVHRFALRVTFLSPDQRQYIQIVVELARQRHLELPFETLQMRALQWERQHTGRSGRVARQFVDDLEADLKHQ
jgi:uncharacterized protein